MRLHNPALCCDEFQVVLKDKEREIIAYKRWNGGGNVLVVVANLRDKPTGEFTIADCGLEDGTWHEHVFNFDVPVTGGVLKDSMGPSEVKIYIKQ